jgi:acyl transferase domain-containing protein
MKKGRIAVLFGGQGKLDRSALERVPARVRSSAGPAADQGLSIYATSLAMYRGLISTGLVPDVIVGYGFGEIAALVAAGAFTDAEGAEIVTARCRALLVPDSEAYTMATVHASPRQVAALLSLLPKEGVSLAAEHSSRESVIVGPSGAVLASVDLAAGLDITVTPLRSTGAPHRRLSRDARTNLAQNIRHLVQHPFRTPAFSPLMCRLYHDDDPLTDCLAQQLEQPIRFAAAVARLVSDNVSLVIECGPLRGLGTILDCDCIADIAFCRTAARRVA